MSLSRPAASSKALGGTSLRSKHACLPPHTLCYPFSPFFLPFLTWWCRSGHVVARVNFLVVTLLHLDDERAPHLTDFCLTYPPLAFVYTFLPPAEPGAGALPARGGSCAVAWGHINPSSPPPPSLLPSTPHTTTQITRLEHLTPSTSSPFHHGLQHSSSNSNMNIPSSQPSTMASTQHHLTIKSLQCHMSSQHLPLLP